MKSADSFEDEDYDDDSTVLFMNGVPIMVTPNANLLAYPANLENGGINKMASGVAIKLSQ